MKKWFIFIAITSVVILSTLVFAGEITQMTANVVQYKIIVNGGEQQFTMPIVTINDRTYVSLREVGEKLDMSVDWDEKNKTIIMNHPQNNEENKLYPFKEGNLWGYEDHLGNVIIEPCYNNARKFSEGLAFVAGEGENGYESGYIDLTGELVISRPVFYFAGNFSEGYAVIIERKWDRSNEVVHVCDTPGPYIFIDKTGKNAFDMEFDTAESFRGGYARVTLRDGTFARINTSGNIVDLE